jgi:hypothetical protein
MMNADLLTRETIALTLLNEQFGIVTLYSLAEATHILQVPCALHSRRIAGFRRADLFHQS